MSQEWVKLGVDCSWKRLQAVAFRSIPGPPQDLKLAVSDKNGEELFTLTEEFTCNPTWPTPPISQKAYPIRLALHSADECVASVTVDLRRLFFVASDLNDLEHTKDLLLLLFFRGHGYYTVEPFAEFACPAATNNSDQIKMMSTWHAQEREIDFRRLQQYYAQLLSSRTTLSELAYQIANYKEKIAMIVQTLRHTTPVNMLSLQSLVHCAAQNSQILQTHSSTGRNLKQELDGQQEIAENFLRAHFKKHSERLTLMQTERKVLEARERLLLARKMKMFAEIYSVFSPQLVLEGFRLIGTMCPAVERDSEVSTALGYACLLLLSLQSYLSLRLQYPVKFQGSRSSLFVGDKEFPLYAVGKNTDKVKMDQAVRYLIQNLRHALKALGHSGDVESTLLVNMLVEQLRNFRG